MPEVPIGDDAYLQWHRLPYHRIGVRTYMRSTHDGSGLNFDPSNFLYQDADDFNFALDTVGPGVLYFVRTNHHHGSPWHYEVDGKDLIVKESATDNPVGANTRLKHSHFMPEELFPSPLVHTWPTTHGADLMWRPVLFKDRFRLAYSRTYYGTGYFIYQQVGVANDHLSREVSQSGWLPPDHRVTELLNRAGSDIGPIGEGITTQASTIKLGPTEKQIIHRTSSGPGVIRALKFTVPRDKAEEFGKCRLMITWDDRVHASVDSPINLFFGTGHIPGDHKSEFLVKGLPVVVRFDEAAVHLECYLPMPYLRSCKN